MIRPAAPVASQIRRLDRGELPVDTVEFACSLLGKTLVHDRRENWQSGQIVETKAYVVGDAASHTFRGPKARNRSLFLERGHAYIYRIYGLLHLLDVVSEPAGIGAGVLLRALEPLEGIALMQQGQGTRAAHRPGSWPASRRAEHWP